MRTLITVIAAAALIAGAITLIWLDQASRAHDNITCKQQHGTQYQLCIAGQPSPVTVPYSLWRTARTGGYYDQATRSVFRDPADDPAAPHGILGGEHGGFGEGGFGHGGGGR